MLSNSVTEALLVNPTTPTDPAGGITNLALTEGTSYDLALFVFEGPSQNARVRLVNPHLNLLSTFTVKEYSTLPFEVAEEVTVTRVATPSTSAQITFEGWGLDEKEEAIDLVEDGRIIRLECALAVASPDGTTTPVRIVLESERPDLPGFHFVDVAGSTARIPVFLPMDEYRGIKEFTITGTTYVVVGLYHLDT